MTKRSRPLITRLRAARILVREWRRTVYDSERERCEAGDDSVSAAVQRELQRFDEAYAALTEAIKVLKP